MTADPQPQETAGAFIQRVREAHPDSLRAFGLTCTYLGSLRIGENGLWECEEWYG